jgi:diguanylate cyclase (GGDEF)-like protein/putative nucleotidyltransferase with HDIG domain
MTWAELPVKLKFYISSLTCLALPITAWAVWNVSSNHYNNGWIVLTILTVITVPFFLLLPSVNATVGIGDAYIMAISMIYGVAPCIVATFLHIFFLSIFSKKPRIRAHQVFFNTSSMVCGAWLYSSVFHLMKHGNVDKIADILIPAVVLVCAYFFINSALTSIAIAWSIGESIAKFWAKTCMPLAIDFSISAVAATIIVSAQSFGDLVPLAMAPLVGAVWGWNKINKARAMEAERHLTEQEQLYLRTVESLALAVDAKDQTTYGHIRRVRAYALGLAKLCGIKDQSELKAIETGSLLHDIGKLAIEDYILNKPGRLSPIEFEKMKKHAAAGDEILQPVGFPYPVAKYVRYHHERWDGLGYPDGLKGEEIPLGARILSIADSFDAIRFSRPYKLSIATDEALEILRTQAGISYDPQLVRLFTEHISELEQTAIKESENAPQLSFRKYSEMAESSSSPVAIPKDISAELVQLLELCNTLSGNLELTDFLPILSQRLRQLLPFTTCVFYVNKGDDRISAAHVSGKFSDLIQEHLIEMGKGISGWVAAYRRPMINTGPALDFKGINADFTLFTDTLVVPIVEADESLGTISLYAEKPISYGQSELHMLETVASFLAPMISNFRKKGASITHEVIDPTTGIHRISYLTAIGPQLISTAGENRTPVSLICIEIKNFGQIVRTFGSNLANSLLKRIADSVKPEMREIDVLVRYGLQGFVAFLPGVREDQALLCVQRLKQQIRNAASIPGQGLTVDCQTGISFYPRDGANVLSLLQSAQESMRADSAEKSASGKKVVDFYRA